MRKMTINELILLFSCPSWEKEMGGATTLLWVSQAHSVNLFTVPRLLQMCQASFLTIHKTNSLLITFLKGPNLFGIILVVSQTGMIFLKRVLITRKHFYTLGTMLSTSLGLFC